MQKEYRFDHITVGPTILQLRVERLVLYHGISESETQA